MDSMLNRKMGLLLDDVMERIDAMEGLMMSMLSLANQLRTYGPKCPTGLEDRAAIGWKGSGRSYYCALVEENDLMPLMPKGIQE